ncbi:hypothetical protein N7532_010043 [Penicillium argentinense]|uniref:Uncharacterized protein n=1 Tax=Penicillium argentinense TaxID=1131581 RepID=A0A9W9ENU8_9EURO|nr:uncharacterized protein N7532_010043 [Penicillium argentinense]KAJ5085272.1 hypothetical protein N7532_010043 [Penicillium argentinense]
MSNNSENMRGTRPPSTRDESTSNPPSNNPTDTSPNTTTEPSSHTSKSSSDQPSLATRIQSSASNLARTAFAPDPTQTLSAVTNGKASPSTPSNAGSFARDISTAQGPSTSGLSGSVSGTRPATDSFRNASNAPASAFEIPAMTEEEFQAQGYTEDSQFHTQFQQGQGQGHQETDKPLDPLQSTTGNWKGKHRAADPVQVYTSAWERATSNTSPTLQDGDGEAVSTLLNNPTFDPSFALDADIQTSDMADEPAPLTRAELQTLDSFRRDLVIPDKHLDTPAVQLNPTSLIPDIDTFLQQDQHSTAGSAVSLRDHVLANLPGANEWVRVQERYHDEVWGFLRPALEAAREEIEEGEEGLGEHEEGPAVRRLRMILEHMRA